MLKPSSAPLTYYPAYCFPVSPTFNTWAKLTAADVHDLKQREGFEGQKVYFHLNHPIKWIRLVGVLVAFEEHPYRWVMILDDSSGATIEITCAREAKTTENPIPGHASTVEHKLGGDTASIGRSLTGNVVDMKGLDIGTVVKVKGGIGEFRGEKQITLERIHIIASTTEEAAAWSELQQFRTSVLSKPWLILPDEEKKLREEADGTARRTADKVRQQKEREAKDERRRKRAEKIPQARKKGKSKRRISEKENKPDHEEREIADGHAKHKERTQNEHRPMDRRKHTRQLSRHHTLQHTTSPRYDALGL